MTINSIQMAENAAFAMQRSIGRYDVTSAELLSFSRRLITEAIDAGPDDEESDNSAWDLHNRRKLDSAGRVISALGTLLKEDDSDRVSLTTLSAIAFCLDGNQVAGRQVAKFILEAEADEPNLLALGVACPIVASECAERCSSNEAKEILFEAHAAIALQQYSLSTLGPQLARYEASARRSGLGFLLGLAVRALRVATQLRFDHVLRDVDFPLKKGVLENLRHAGRYLALPSQVAALTTPDLLASSRPTLVSLPTGSGKTLVGLVAAASAMRDRNDVTVFLAPYLAIRRQVTEAARGMFATLATVSGAADDAIDAGRRLIVDTPEAFDARLRRDPRLAQSLRAIVFDEAHLLGNDARGMLSDGLLTRITLVRDERKIVLLSAVLDDSKAVSGWLENVGRPLHAKSKWRPAARRIAVWRSDGALEWVRTITTADGSSRAFRVAVDRVEPAHPVLSTGHSKASAGPRYRECDDNVALLATYLWNRDRECTLVVVGTRIRARTQARRIAARLVPKVIRSGRCEETVQFIQQTAPAFLDMIPLIDRGVVYHSAALPKRLRQLIEVACAHGDFDFVCATTSLAEGADLPFGRTILADWTFSAGDGNHDTFPAALWRNIAGRCGRPSSHIEGETIIVEQTPAAAFRNADDRWSALRRMLLGKVEVDSPLSARGPKRIEVAEQLVYQTVAAVAENPDLDEPHEVFVRRLLSPRLSSTTSADAVTTFVTRRLFEGDDPIAVRNSPVRLTAKGDAIRRSPVLPDASSVLLRLSQGDARFDDPADLCAEVLLSTADCVDLIQTRMADIARGRPVKALWVRSADLTAICGDWLEGLSVGQILLLASRRQRRNTRADDRDLAQWISTGEASADWIQYYEKMSDFVRIILADYMPRALTALELFLGDTRSTRLGVDVVALRSRAAELSRGVLDADGA